MPQKGSCGSRIPISLPNFFRPAMQSRILSLHHFYLSCRKVRPALYTYTSPSCPRVLLHFISQACSLGDQDYYIELTHFVLSTSVMTILDRKEIKCRNCTHFFSCEKCLADFSLNMADIWIYFCSLLKFFYDGGN